MKHPEFDKLLKSLPEVPATIEQLKALEEKLAIHLSDDQLEFLLHYQGARFQLCEYLVDEAYLRAFLEINQIEGWHQLLRIDVELDMGIYCYTDHFIPIAVTSFYSEYLCLPISPLFRSGVWAMNYDIDESGLPKSEWKARIVHLANSIDEFLTICANNVCED